MKYHALFVIFEKAGNLKLSSAAKIGGALRIKLSRSARLLSSEVKTAKEQNQHLKKLPNREKIMSVSYASNKVTVSLHIRTV